MSENTILAKEPKRTLRLTSMELPETLALGDWFARFFRQAPLGVALVDHQFRFLAANPALCGMLGLAEAGLLHKTVADLACPEDQPTLVVFAPEPVSNRATTSPTELRLIGGGGEAIWVSLTSIELPGAASRRPGGIVLFEDITVRREADRRLHAAETALFAERSMLESKNAALRELLEQIDTHKRQSAQQLQANVNRVIRPMLQILADKLPPSDGHLVGLLDSALGDLLDPFIGKLDRRAACLTRRETEVCSMIRNGFSSKQIASVLHTSICTVHNQRRSIRKKLGIDDGKTNLESFLKSF